MVHQHVHRAEGVADDLEALADRVDVGEVSRNREPLPRIGEVGSEFLDVLRRPRKQRDPTALRGERPGERRPESGADPRDNGSACHTHG